MAIKKNKWKNYTPAEDAQILELNNLKPRQLAAAYRTLGEKLNRSADGIYQRLKKLNKKKAVKAKAEKKTIVKETIPVKATAHSDADIFFSFEKWSVDISSEGIGLFRK